MKTLNLTKYGALVLVEYTGMQKRIISTREPKLDINFPLNDTDALQVTLGAVPYLLNAIGDLQVSGVAATDQEDALAKLATVFPEASTGSGSTTGSDVAPFDYTANGGETTVNTGKVNKTFLFAIRGSNVLKIITSGVPTVRELLYNTSTGDITFGEELGFGEYFFSLYK